MKAEHLANGYALPFTLITPPPPHTRLEMLEQRTSLFVIYA